MNSILLILRDKYYSFIVTFFIIVFIITGCSPAENKQTENNVVETQKPPQETITPKGDKDLKVNKVNEGVGQSSTPIPQKKEKTLPKVIEGLVRVQDIADTVIIDLKYATADNFTKKAIYPFKVCLLRKETAEKLGKANKALNSKGYRIKVYDGYRPPFAQKIFWDLVKDEKFVANPSKGGSIHSKGGAVDVTMVDKEGHEVEMPSKFDDFTERASRKNRNMSQIEKQNLELLTGAMQVSGFNTIETEWWHFNDKDSGTYQVVNVNPKVFEE